MWLIVLPMTFIGQTCVLRELGIPVGLVIFEFAFNYIAITMNKETMTLYLAINPLTIILSTIRPSLHTFSMLNPLVKTFYHNLFHLSDISCAVLLIIEFPVHEDIVRDHFHLALILARVYFSCYHLEFSPSF